MLGGEEDPCVGPDTLRVIQEEEGRTCPRVDLDPENAIAANLFTLNASEQEGLASLWFETESDVAELGPQERADIVRRVITVRNRPDVVALLKEPQKA